MDGLIKFMFKVFIVKQLLKKYVIMFERLETDKTIY